MSYQLWHGLMTGTDETTLYVLAFTTGVCAGFAVGVVAMFLWSEL